MALQLRNGPAIQPVSLESAKTFLKIDGTDDDMLIASLITAARIYIETTLAKILITQSWSFFKDNWPSGGLLQLPLSPVQTVEEIRIHDDNGSHVVLSSNSYDVDLISSSPRIMFHQINQSGSMRTLNPIEIRFSAGFGDAVDDVPADLTEALMLLCAHWYEQREPIGFGGSFNEIPGTISALLNNHKTYRVQ